MIRVEKFLFDTPASIRTDSETKGKVESDKAVALFTSNCTKEERAKFEFKAYAEQDVRDKLVSIFNNKCAFCEIGYGGAGMDIEHFRPKRRIDPRVPFSTVPVEPGYFWLSSTWDNLLLSCIHCNRLSSHQHASTSKKGPPEVRVSGKGNFFPLSDESFRCRYGDDLEAEEPHRLLLNPCTDQPEDHFTFDRFGMIFAKVTNGSPSKRGQMTIDVLGLKRLPLVEERRKTATEISYRLAALEKILSRLRISPGCRATKTEALNALMDIRHLYLSPTRPFLAMCRDIFRKFITKHDVMSIIRARG